MARTKNAAVPQVGAEAPEFNLPSAQGGNLRLSMRTVRGPVIVAFYRGAWNEEDVSYFRQLAGKEDEINLALGSIVGIAVSEVQDSRDFLKQTGLKSYVLYDYARRATPAWGLMDSDPEHGDFARPATFLVDSDHNIVAAWTDDRPSPDELLAKVSGMTGLPKPPPEEGEDAEEGEEKPKKRPARAAKKDAEADGEAAEKPATEKPSPEEREKLRAERKAAGETAAAEKSGEQPGDEPKPGAAAKDESAGNGVAAEEKPARSEKPDGQASGEPESGEATGEKAESIEGSDGSGSSESKAPPANAEASDAGAGDRAERKEDEKEG